MEHFLNAFTVFTVHGGNLLASLDEIRDFAVEIARSCNDDKCQDVICLELGNLTSIAEYFVIGTGTSDRQIRSVGDNVRKMGKDQGRVPLAFDGREYGHWILVDFGDIMVHLFSPEYRELYDLEILWGDAPKVAWQREQAEN